jgi:acyl-CoA synthetase (AMP-forming)/AMP-acid ligase II
MIKIGGVNVAPLEVEQLLLQHPDIVQAFVVGIPEIVAAAVELRGRAATDPLARRDLPERRGAAPGDRGSCAAVRKASRAGTLWLTSRSRQKATIAAGSPPDR